MLDVSSTVFIYYVFFVGVFIFAIGVGTLMTIIKKDKQRRLKEAWKEHFKSK